MLRFLADPSGGLRYHWRAQLGQARWAAFRRDLREFMRPWLRAQQKVQRPLLLIGPSAGYTLPWPELRGFSKLHAVEPDPFARMLLRKRCQHIELDAGPALGWSGRAYRAHDLHTWFEGYPDHALLFCNLLGQLGPAGHALSQDWHQAFRTELQGRAWLSYHDLASSQAVPDLEYLKAHWPPEQGQAQLLEPGLWQRVYAKAPSPLHVVDHGTAELFGFTRSKVDARAFFEWPILPGRWHVIEGLASATDSRGCAKTSVALG